MGSPTRIFTLMLVSVASAAAADANAGMAVYETECKDCHRMTGEPVPKVMKTMLAEQNVKMRDLKADEVQSKSNAQWRKQIVEGIGKMKPVKGLTDPQLENIFAYMRTLKKK